MRQRVRIASLVTSIGVVAAMLTVASTATAAPAGPLDTTFATTGTVSTSNGNLVASATLVQPDGKVVVALRGLPAARTDRFTVQRFLRDGALDQTFGTGGSAVLPSFFGTSNGDEAQALAVQADGRIVVAGQATSGNATSAALAVARLSSTGVLDSSFGAAGQVKVQVGTNGQYDVANGVAVAPSGAIVLAGTWAQGWTVARVLASGAVDTGFGTAGVTTIDLGDPDFDAANAVALQAVPGDSDVAPRILVGGSGSHAGATGSGDEDFALARLGSTGALDPTFGTAGIVRTDRGGPDDAVTALATLPDGRIAAFGTRGTAGRDVGTGLTVYRANGALDTGFGSNGSIATGSTRAGTPARTLAVRADGTMFTAGTTTATSRDVTVSATTPTGAAATVFPGGTSTVTLASPADDLVAAAAIDPSTGRLVVAGGTTGPTATTVSRLLTGITPITVTVSGSAAYPGATPTLTSSDDAPAWSPLTGTLRCTTADGGTPLTALAAGPHTLDASSCSGLTNADPGYQVTYLGAPGGFVVAAGVAPQITATPGPDHLTAGVAYSAVFTATGTPTPTFSVQSGALPTGVALSPAGRLQGTATTAGTSTAVIAAANGVSPTATATLQLTVDPGPTVALTQVVATPSSTTAGAPVAFTATGEDAFGNATGDVTAATTFTATTPGASCAGASCTPTQVGTLVVTSSIAGTAGPVTDVEVAPATSAAIAVLSGGAQTAAAGTSVAAPFVVRVADRFGNPVPGAPVTFDTPGATVTTVSTTTATDGTASTTMVAGDTAGTFALTATSGSLSVSGTVTVTPGAATAVVVVAGDGQHAAVGTTFGTDLRVRVTDGFGNPVAGQQVRAARVSGPLTGPAGTTLVTGADGVAVVPAPTAGTTPGAAVVGVWLGASATGTPAVTFGLTVDPGAPVTLTVVAGDGQTQATRRQYDQPLVLQWADAYGNPTPSAPDVTVATASGTVFAVDPATARPLPTVTLTPDATGRVSVPLFAGRTAGVGTLAVRATGVPTATVRATVVPGRASELTVVSGDAQTAVATRVFAAPIVVAVADRWGNPIAGRAVVVTVDSGSATFGRPGETRRVLRTGADGRASTALRAGADGGVVALTARIAAAPAGTGEIVTGLRATVSARADLGTTVSGPATLASGQSGSVVVRVENRGPSGSGPVTVVLTVPPRWQIAATDPAAATTVGRVTTWTVPALASGAAVLLRATVVAPTPRGAAGTVVVQATGTATDPTPGPNRQQLVITAPVV